MINECELPSDVAHWIRQFLVFSITSSSKFVFALALHILKTKVGIESSVNPMKMSLGFNLWPILVLVCPAYFSDSLANSRHHSLSWLTILFILSSRMESTENRCFSRRFTNGIGYFFGLYTEALSAMTIKRKLLWTKHLTRWVPILYMR